MESEIKTRGFAIDVSRDKLTVVKAELQYGNLIFCVKNEMNEIQKKLRG
ncbi:hypothetical protein AB1303_02170 [Saccharolobus solfataricus]